MNTKKPVQVVRAKAKRNRIPDEILENEMLNRAIGLLPANYNFEIHKTVWRILTEKVAVVALQFPEGLLMYACIISDIFTEFCKVQCVILGDVTYGACCVDDFTAQKLGATLLVHYGHSCLVPIDNTQISTMYVFVEIYFEASHLIQCIASSFPPNSSLALMGTIQFVGVLHTTKKVLTEQHAFSSVVIPQARPLSLGETLGCTSPVLSGCTDLVFVADGRFHLEAAMIMNPQVRAFRYDPYSKTMTEEQYDIEKMKSNRMGEIVKSRSANVFGLILGTLGRQGSRHIFDRLKRLLEDKGKTVIPFLMAEINPIKLAAIELVDVWVQVACPRLSVDWGLEYKRPLLTSYELEVALNSTIWQEVYPMDYYSQQGGSWGNMTQRKSTC